MNISDLTVKTVVTNEKIDAYVYDFVGPLEAQFFTKKELDKLEADRLKFEMTNQYYRAVIDNPDYWMNLEKATLAGQIFSSAQADTVFARLKAMNGSGARIDLNKSIVHPSGRFVIMSDALSLSLEMAGDGDVRDAAFPKLLEGLEKEGLAEKDLLNLKASISQFGAIIVQRGVYFALKDLFEEALAVSNIKASFEMYKKRLESPVPAAISASAAPGSPHGVSLSDLKNRISTPIAVPKPPIVPSPVSATPPLNPTEIKREITTKELPSEDKPALKPNLPRPSGPIVRPAPLPPAKPRVTGPLPGLPRLDDIMATEDLRKIQLGHLRQGYLGEQVKTIKTKIVYLASANKVLPVQVSAVFQDSPLFKLYLKMGRMMMEGVSPDKKPTFDEIAAKLKQSGEEPLTVQEFEAVADLRKDLEQT